MYRTRTLVGTPKKNISHSADYYLSLYSNKLRRKINLFNVTIYIEYRNFSWKSIFCKTRVGIIIKS